MRLGLKNIQKHIFFSIITFNKIQRPQSEAVVEDVENEVCEVVGDDGDEDKPVAGLLDIGVEQYEQTLT